MRPEIPAPNIAIEMFFMLMIKFIMIRKSSEFQKAVESLSDFEKLLIVISLKNDGIFLSVNVHSFNNNTISCKAAWYFQLNNLAIEVLESEVKYLVILGAVKMNLCDC